MGSSDAQTTSTVSAHTLFTHSSFSPLCQLVQTTQLKKATFFFYSSCHANKVIPKRLGKDRGHLDFIVRDLNAILHHKNIIFFTKLLAQVCSYKKYYKLLFPLKLYVNTKTRSELPFKM